MAKYSRKAHTVSCRINHGLDPDVLFLCSIIGLIIYFTINNILKVGW